MTSSAHRTSLLPEIRVRGLLNGLSYAVAVCALLIVAWSVQASLEVLHSGAAAILQVVIASIRRHAFDMFPGMLFIVVAVNLAPSTGPRRLAWLLVSACLCALWRQLALDASFNNPLWAQGMVATVFQASLVVAVCAYRSSGQSAADRLLSNQIDRTTLDIELRRGQLQLSRAQIEPHFLFNTLAAVGTLARTDSLAAVGMLDHLLRYFEAALPQMRNDQISLRSEMELIDAYLAIHRVRMGARLAYEVILPSDLADSRVPSMMLLTLVENALKHGVNQMVQGGLIRVCARAESDALLLAVTDDGPGMRSRDGYGMGLANIRLRLLMSYGEAAVLSLASSQPHGVAATISIPLRPMPHERA